MRRIAPMAAIQAAFFSEDEPHISQNDGIEKQDLCKRQADEEVKRNLIAEAKGDACVTEGGGH